MTTYTKKREPRCRSFMLGLLLALSSAGMACGAPEEQIVLSKPKPTPPVTAFNWVYFQSGEAPDIMQLQIQAPLSISPVATDGKGLETKISLKLCERTCNGADIMLGREAPSVPVPIYVELMADTDDKILAVTAQDGHAFFSGRTYQLSTADGIASADGNLTVAGPQTARLTIPSFAKYLNSLLNEGRTFYFSWGGNLNSCAKSQSHSVSIGGSPEEAIISCSGLVNHQPPQSDVLARFNARGFSAATADKTYAYKVEGVMGNAPITLKISN